jgi:hypothetical protein
MLFVAAASKYVHTADETRRFEVFFKVFENTRLNLMQNSAVQIS